MGRFRCREFLREVGMIEYKEFIKAHPLLIGGWLAVLAAWVGFEVWSRLKGPQKLSSSEVIRLINQEAAYIVDVRSLAAYQKSHIQGAVHVAPSEWKEKSKHLPADKTTVMVCDRGQQAWGLACRAPQRVSILAQGMQGWISENLPVSKQ